MPQHANQYPATRFQRTSIHKNINEQAERRQVLHMKNVIAKYANVTF
jgi:polyisoprenoid-binding protein YceI